MATCQSLTKVTQNQVLLLNRWPGQQFSYAFRDGVLLGQSAPTLRLKVTARDRRPQCRSGDCDPDLQPVR